MRSVSCVLRTLPLGTATLPTPSQVALQGLALWLVAGVTLVACGDGTTEPAPPPTVASVEVTPTTVTLVCFGETAQLTATARDASGNTISGKTFTWSSDDEDCATVSSSGLVTASGNGIASITASVDGVSGSASITVQQEMASLVVVPIGASVSGVGATQVFTAEPQDANGDPIPAIPVTWASLNPNVATVDGGGTATAVESGQVTVAASACGVAGHALLTVSVPGIAGVASWAPEVLPGWSLIDVWGTSSSDVYAVGESGAILHYDGTDWNAMTTGTSNLLGAVWGTSSSDVYAVGESEMILHFNGAAWSATASGAIWDLLGIWGVSSSDIYVVGDRGTMLHHDGTTWSTVATGTSEHIYSVWGTSSNDVYAVGYTGTILHYDGTAWTAMVSGTSEHLIAAWGTSSSDVYAVGWNGTILHYDGTVWSAMTSGTSRDLFAVWGTSSSDVYAVGGDGTIGTILHYDGTAWGAMTSGVSQEFNAVWGTSSGDVYAVVHRGTILRGQR